ncbi:MAG: hypothetical protein ACM3ZQ_11710 [Bacillota bacterium]
MNFRGVKLPMVLIIAVVTLAVFLGGQMAIAAVTIDRPLLKLLEGRTELTGFEIDKHAQPLRITVGLKPDADLKTVYGSLDKELTTLLGRNEYVVKVTDNRDETLRTALYDMHYAIREGLTRGNFTEMSAEIEKIAAAKGIDSHALWVDDQRLYLQLRHGDSALFEIYERTPQATSKLAG